MRLLVVLTVIGLSGCAAGDAMCGALKRPVVELRAGLEANPQTSDAVGEPATDVVTITEAGCR